MRKSIISIFTGSLLVFSCGKESEVSLPDWVMPQDSMVIIITELQLIEGWISHQRSFTSIDSIKPEPYYRGMFEKHNADESRFDTSMKYYLVHPSKLVPVYEKVLEELIRKQAVVESGNTP